MRIHLPLATLVLLAACGGAAPKSEPAVPVVQAPITAAPAPAPATEAPKPEITVVALPPGKSPGIAIRLLFRAGYADDPVGAEGVTILAAHLMTDGGTESLSAFELRQKLFPWAASIGVQVDADMTVFTATVHKDHVDQFLPVLTDVLTHPRWEASELERLRRDAIDDIEKRLRSNADEDLGKEALSHMLFAGHPYGRYVGGSVAGLKSLDMNAIKAHAARVFSKARLTIGVAGAYPADLPEKLKAALASLPDGTAPAELPAAVGLKDTRMLIVEKEAPAVAFSLGAPLAVGRADPDFPALMVGVSAFGEHRQFHGRLMQRLREERGLNYGDYAYPEHFVQEGWSTLARVNIGRRQQTFSIWLRPVQPGDALFALRLGLHEYDKLLTEGLTEEEVKRAAQFLEGYTRLWAKNAHRRLGLAQDDAYYGTPERLEAFRAALPGLNAARVNAALRKHLPAPDQLRIAVVTSKAAEWKQAVLAGAPSPKTYNAEKPAALLEEDKKVATRPLGIPEPAIRILPVNELF